MMRNSIATYKESLSRLASDLLDATEELQISGSRAGEDASISDRRMSHRFAQSITPNGSPVRNGINSGPKDEIEQHKAEIERLQTSEAEVKALAVNYAAILKEKEEQLSRLHAENSSLKKSLEAKNAVKHVSKDEDLSPITNNSATLKRIAEQSPNRHLPGNNAHKVIISKKDMLSNGDVQANSEGVQRKIELKGTNSHSNEKELGNLLEESSRQMAALRASHETEIKQLRAKVENERQNLENMQLMFQEEQKLNESTQKEVRVLKIDNERISMEMKELHTELNARISEIRRLQMELKRRDTEDELNESVESLKIAILTLEKENSKLKMEKNEHENALTHNLEQAQEKTDSSSKNLTQNSNKLNKIKEEMAISIQQLEKTLKDTCKERDKALQDLARLKQHLLNKELEESDKMDEDSKVIEELRANSEYQRARILQLEKALKQNTVKLEEIKKIKSDELQKSNEIINDLKHKLANCMSIINSKNDELLNLQTALGQYYAETEAMERLERDFSIAKEESAKISELLKTANQELEMSKLDKDITLSKLSQAERMLSEYKHTVQKLQEDNSKLRRAVEQSMTRINRMSLDSDYYVDRRIVIKLLVTYFQRNYSKEVLDLMVRMLGFSEEDKQRVGFAQQNTGKGVVRGVLGLPGRLVGGILGGSSPDVSSHSPSENQSFADLWVDFLLKETEERERRVSAEVSAASSSTTERSTPNSGARFPSVHSSTNQITSLVHPEKNHLLEHSDAEFATVPLTSSVLSSSDEDASRFSRLPPRY